MNSCKYVTQLQTRIKPKLNKYKASPKNWKNNETNECKWYVKVVAYSQRYTISITSLKKLCLTHNIKFSIVTILSVQFSSVKYIHAVAQPISRTFSSFKIETLYPLSNFPFPLPTANGNDHSIYEFEYVRCLI